MLVELSEEEEKWLKEIAALPRVNRTYAYAFDLALVAQLWIRMNEALESKEPK